MSRHLPAVAQPPIQSPIRCRTGLRWRSRTWGAGLQLLTARRVADGRYRLALSFSDGVLVAGKDAPRLRTFSNESQLFVQEGETVSVASAVDPETGETVEAELTLKGGRYGEAVAGVRRDDEVTPPHRPAPRGTR